MNDLERKKINEYDEACKEWNKFYAERPWLIFRPVETIGEVLKGESKEKKEIEKENERRKKEGLKPLPPKPHFPDVSSFYSYLSAKEQQNVKRRLREQIISEEKRLPKDRERRNYYVVSSGPYWRELSFPIFIGFIIGFAPVWLIYAFIRWVIIVFIVGGFKGKSLRGSEPDRV